MFKNQMVGRPHVPPEVGGGSVLEPKHMPRVPLPERAWRLLPCALPPAGRRGSGNREMETPNQGTAGGNRPHPISTQPRPHEDLPGRETPEPGHDAQGTPRAVPL